MVVQSPTDPIEEHKDTRQTLSKCSKSKSKLIVSLCSLIGFLGVEQCSDIKKPLEQRILNNTQKLLKMGYLICTAQLRTCSNKLYFLYFPYTVLAQRVWYFVLLYYSHKSWSWFIGNKNNINLYNLLKNLFCSPSKVPISTKIILRNTIKSSKIFNQLLSTQNVPISIVFLSVK